MATPSQAARGTRSRLLQTLGITFTRQGGNGNGGIRRSSAGGHASAGTARTVESRLHFEAAGPLLAAVLPVHVSTSKGVVGKHRSKA